MFVENNINYFNNYLNQYTLTIVQIIPEIHIIFPYLKITTNISFKNYLKH